MSNFPCEAADAGGFGGDKYSRHRWMFRQPTRCIALCLSGKQLETLLNCDGIEDCKPMIFMFN